jgi:cardiolipin synthase A/B
MPRGRTVLMIAVLAWMAVAVWNTQKPLPPGTHVASLATRLTESQVQVLSAPAASGEIEARELAVIDHASELIVIDAAPLSRAVGQGLLLQRIKRPNIKIVLVSDPRSEAYGGTPVEYLESLERAGVIVARVRLDRLRDCIPLYSALWRLTLGWWSEPFDEHPAEAGLRASLRARNRKWDQRRLLVADDGAGGWSSLLTAAPDLAVQITGGLARDMAASELEIAAWSSGDDRLPVPPRAAARGPGSIDARFLTEGAIRGAMLDALSAAGAGDEVGLAAVRLSDRRVIGAVLRAAGQGAHVRVLLDAGAAPNFPVAAELERDGGGNIELRWRVPPAPASASLAWVARRGELSASVGAADFTRPSLDDINLESAIEVRLPEREAAAHALEGHFAEEWAAGAAYTRYAVESQTDYWQYRFKQAAALAAF